MANANISVPHSQFTDKISASERLLMCGLECGLKKHPITKYRLNKEKQKAFSLFLQRSIPASV